MPLAAEEICVACDGPAATYRCTPELPTSKVSSELSASLEATACTTVLAETGGHKTCRPIKSDEPCEGGTKTVTLTDYQRAIAGDGQPSTYQPGAVEIARRNVEDTLRCVASLFGDC